MIVAIMQPYFFPYIGYFQLMAAVDAFVILDDVQYVERSWVNRNRIRRDGESEWLTMPVRKGSRSELINQRHYVLGYAKDKVARKIANSYRKAPGFAAVNAQILSTIDDAETNVAKLNARLLTAVAELLGVRSTLMFSSEIRGYERLAGQPGIIDICRRVGASRYVNAIGGARLYKEAEFADSGVGIRFLRTRVSPVTLASGPEYLSIIDDLMGDGAEGCAAKISDYELLSAEAARKLA